MPKTPADCCVLVVEDESAVLMLVEDMLSDLGYREIHTAMSVPEAMPIAETSPLTFAILDVNLGEQRSFSLADRLRGREIPFLFATGYGSTVLDSEYVGSVVLAKPFRLHDLEVAINRALARAA